MHRIACVLGAVGALSACSSAATVAANAQSYVCPTTAPYVLLRGADTLSIERLEITDSSFFSRVDAVAQGAALKFGGRVDKDGLVDSMTVEIWAGTRVPTAKPDQHATVAFSPAGAHALVAAAGRAPQLQHDVAPAGTLPYMANISLFLELVLRRSTQTTGTTTVPLLWLFTGGERDSAEVLRVGPTSFKVVIGDVAYLVERTANNRMLAAEVVPKPNGDGARVRISRTECDERP